MRIPSVAERIETVSIPIWSARLGRLLRPSALTSSLTEGAAAVGGLFHWVGCPLSLNRGRQLGKTEGSRKLLNPSAAPQQYVGQFFFDAAVTVVN